MNDAVGGLSKLLRLRTSRSDPCLWRLLWEVGG